MTDSARTQAFLRMIARRLSGRDDCKKMQYVIGIGLPTDPELLKSLPEGETVDDHIFFKPDVHVYKDTYHRSGKDLYKIADLIITKYFPDLVMGRDAYGYLKVDTTKLTKGIYEYQMSVDGKRRRWVRRSLFDVLKPIEN